MGEPLCSDGTEVHQCRSRLSWHVRRTVPDQVLAEATTSCSSLKKNRATRIAKYRNCVYPAREARAFTLTHRLFAAALQSSDLASEAMLLSLTVGALNSLCS